MSNNLWDPKKFEMFSEARIAIMKKTKEHPPLNTLLLQYDPANDWPAMIGEIAAYCGVVLDGYYSQADLAGLEDMIYQKLSEASMVLGSTPIIGSTKVH
jgi:hypothetical protein